MRIKGKEIVLKSRRGSCKTIISQILGGNYICFRLFNRMFVLSCIVIRNVYLYLQHIYKI